MQMGRRGQVWHWREQWGGTLGNQKGHAATSPLLRNVGSELPALLVSHKKLWKTGFGRNFLFLNLAIIQIKKKISLGPKHTSPSQTGSVGQQFASSRQSILQDKGPLTSAHTSAALALWHCRWSPGFPSLHAASLHLRPWNRRAQLSHVRSTRIFFSIRKKKMFSEWLANKSGVYSKQIILKCM